MSRVGSSPIVVPSGVNVSFDGDQIFVKGSGGVLHLIKSALVDVQIDQNRIHFSPTNNSRFANAMTGTIRQLVNNMVIGVGKGFEKKLVLVGVGYKAQASGGSLSLSVGYSHAVNFVMPDGVFVETPSPTEILVKGIDSQRVGQVASKIRSTRSPEPYKGKGIRYFDEKILIKETKKK